MPLTMITTQTELARRLGPYVALVDVPSLAGQAARALPVGMANPLAPTDAELATIPADRIDKFLDVAESKALDYILANLDADELIRVGIETPLADVLRILGRRSDYLHTYLRQTYQYGLATVSVGVLSLGFSQTGDGNEFGA